MHLVKRELSIITNFNHPNVVQVLDIVEDKVNYYIIMEYCEKGELFNYIVEKQRLSEKESAFFFYQLVNGVHHIHKQNFVHRDLKPENLLLTDNMILKIIDFGLSAKFDGSQFLSTKCGSPSYAAPEIIQGQKYDGFKTDVWCIGIILYAMLAGFLPFEGEDNGQLFRNILEGNIEFPDYISERGIDMILLLLNPRFNNFRSGKTTMR